MNARGGPRARRAGRAVPFACSGPCAGHLAIDAMNFCKGIDGSAVVCVTELPSIHWPVVGYVAAFVQIELAIVRLAHVLGQIHCSARRRSPWSVFAPE
jgi:hypothetical protein